eukprot:4636123-Prymnesium_polylepis.1
MLLRVHTAAPYAHSPPPRRVTRGGFWGRTISSYDTHPATQVGCMSSHRPFPVTYSHRREQEGWPHRRWEREPSRGQVFRAQMAEAAAQQPGRRRGARTRTGGARARDAGRRRRRRR